MQHLNTLLAAPDPAVVLATLQTLVSFVRKTPSSSVRWQGSPELNSRLLTLAQGWNGKEEGLDLAACAREGGVPPGKVQQLPHDCQVFTACSLSRHWYPSIPKLSPPP